MTAAERRRLSSVVEYLRQGNAEPALHALCQVLRVPVPSIPPRRVDPARIPEGRMERRAVPKPSREINPQNVRDYVRRNPLCEVKGCGRKGTAHHVRNRSLSGSDADENLLSLCPVHHLAGSSEGFHHLGPRGFLDWFGRRLSNEAIGKIAAAWRLEVPAAAGGR